MILITVEHRTLNVFSHLKPDTERRIRIEIQKSRKQKECPSYIEQDTIVKSL